VARPTNETLIISAILNTGDVTLAAQQGIRPEHFNEENRRKYQWILSCYKQFGSCPSVTSFMATYPTFPYDSEQSEVKLAAHMVKRDKAKVDLLVKARAALQNLEHDEVEEAYKHFDDFRMEVTTPRPQNSLVDHSFLDNYNDDPEVRIGLPWPTLQEHTAGLGGGELWYFAARQGHGKSSYLLDLAAEAAWNGHRVVFYSLEMTKRQTQVRLHAALGRRLGVKHIDANAMLRRTWNPAMYKDLLQRIESEVLGEVHIHEMSMGLVTPAVVDANAGDYDLSVVDYIGLMRNDERVPAIKDYRIIAEISNGLKGIALAKHHPIIAASQINRDGVSTSWRPPALHTLAQSDHLGNDGDVVITMKRYGLGASVCSLEKNRHGMSGLNMWTRYDANRGDFQEITQDDADEIRASED
jgi:replicative DNA helicase